MTEYQRTWVKRNLDRVHAQHKTYRDKVNKILKIECFAAYGGRCECCGESNIAFLTIDHINNDGWQDRPPINRNGKRSSRGGHKIWRRLRREGYPTDNYRLLCWNCNSGRDKAINKICPHKVDGYTNCLPSDWLLVV